MALGAAGCGKTCVAYVGTVCVEKQGLYDVQRFRPIIEAALRHCGGTWEQLQGWSVDLSPGHIDCADANAMLVMGCSDFGSHTITIRATTCPEQTSLAVEVCNVVTHRDSDGDHDSYPLDLCEDPELWWASNGQQGCMSPYMRPCPWTYHY